MKTIQIITVVTAVVLMASCVKDNTNAPVVVPQKVQDKFAAEYSGTNVQWEQEGEYFEAEFEVNGVEQEIVYDAEGNVIETEQEIAVSELPKAVTDYIAANYAGYKIVEAEIEQGEEGTFYEAELQGKGQELEVEFDANGNFLEEEVEGDDDDDNENDDD